MTTWPISPTFTDGRSPGNWRVNTRSLFNGTDLGRAQVSLCRTPAVYINPSVAYLAKLNVTLGHRISYFNTTAQSLWSKSEVQSIRVLLTAQKLHIKYFTHCFSFATTWIMVSYNIMWKNVSNSIQSACRLRNNTNIDFKRDNVRTYHSLTCTFIYAYVNKIN